MQPGRDGGYLSHALCEPEPRALDLRELGRSDFRLGGVGDPEIEFVFTDRPEPGSYTEHGGMAQAKRDWLSVSPPMNKRERHASGRSAPRARWRLCVGRLGGLVNEYASAA